MAPSQNKRVYSFLTDKTGPRKAGNTAQQRACLASMKYRVKFIWMKWHILIILALEG